MDRVERRRRRRKSCPSPSFSSCGHLKPPGHTSSGFNSSFRWKSEDLKSENGILVCSKVVAVLLLYKRLIIWILTDVI